MGEAAPVSVLVIDDDVDFALTVRDVLASELPGMSLRTDSAVTADEARARSLGGSHDVILLDYRLGPDDGIELLRDLRSSGLETPVIVMTGWADEAVVVRAMKAGATDYLSKSKLRDGVLGAAIRHCIAINTRDAQNRKIEGDLRASEARFREVFEEAPIGIALLDARGGILRANTALCEMLEYTERELLALAPWAPVHADDRAIAAEQAGRLFAREISSYQLEKRYVSKRGRVVWARLTARTAHGELRIAMIEDITARKTAERALQETTRLLEEAQAIAHVGSWWSGLGPTGGGTWSRECYRILGMSENAPPSVEAFYRVVHPDDRGRVRAAVEAAVAGTTPYDIEHRIALTDGALRWVHGRGVVERNDAGEPTRMVGTVQDVTERYLARAAQAASEDRFRRIVESTSEGVWTYDANGVTTFMNEPMAQMLGLAAADAVGRSVFEFLDPTSAPSRVRPFEDHQRKERGRVDRHLRRADGTSLLVSVQANALLGFDGRSEGGLALVADVSAQRRGEEARARLAAVVASSDDAIISRDLSGVITSWNAGAERLYQYASADAIGHPGTLIVPEDERDNEADVVRRILDGESVRSYDARRRRKDGTIVEVAVSAGPIRDADGAIVGFATIARDLTDRRQAEEALRRTETQFRQAQKMEAVGRLAGGIAHDFNNLLSVILSYSELSLDALKEGDPLRTDLEEIHAAGERASNLTRQLLAFSRQQVLQPRVIDLQETVAGMRSMLGRLLGEDIELTTETSATLDPVHADPGQIEQVIMNLAVNARDAMPDGGLLRLELANVAIDAAVAERRGRSPGTYVMLSMTDTGSGMSQQTQARIFEPFFTTKEHGKGTGLGLSTVFGIVEQSGGFIDVTSAIGEGTTFRVYLPRSAAHPEASPALEARAPMRGAGTILLVEDDDHVRAVACAILRRSGYTVLDTANGGEAFLVATSHEGSIDLLLTDVVLPRMNGRVLAERLAGTFPAMRVLYASGYTDDAIVRHGVLDPGVAFLQKPFTPDGLLRKVAEVLASPKTSLLPR